MSEKSQLLNQALAAWEKAYTAFVDALPDDLGAETIMKFDAMLLELIVEVEENLETEDDPETIAVAREHMKFLVAMRERYAKMAGIAAN